MFPHQRHYVASSSSLTAHGLCLGFLAFFLHPLTVCHLSWIYLLHSCLSHSSTPLVCQLFLLLLYFPTSLCAICKWCSTIAVCNVSSGYSPIVYWYSHIFLLYFPQDTHPLQIFPFVFAIPLLSIEKPHRETTFFSPAYVKAHSFKIVIVVICWSVLAQRHNLRIVNKVYIPQVVFLIIFAELR